MEELTLKTDRLTARIKNQGAELTSLRTTCGTELLWQADPKVWGRHAPVLFPIVGRLSHDHLIHEGRSYPLNQHGFARDQLFEIVHQEENRCTFRLGDTPETRYHFPFAFELEISYYLFSSSLQVGYSVTNPAAGALYVSIGGHPAFNWPLTPTAAKQEHAIEFSDDETAPVRRLNNGLLTETPYPTPISAGRLPLADELFEQDALIFDRLESTKVSYHAPGTPRITLHFRDFPQLGIWTKPGADFICIEPWQGYASPEGFDGEFKDKPGVVTIAPQEQRRWQYTIDVAY